MNKEKKNIKNYQLYLWVFIFVNLIIFIGITLGNNLNYNSLNEIYKSFNAKDGILVAVSMLVTFILNGVLTSDVKYILAFWRIKNPLPGTRVFTELIGKDCRVDKQDIIKKYGELPTEANAQNKLWYKIYKPNEFDPMIFDSQRSFLLARDLTGLSFIFLIIYTIATFISEVRMSTSLGYICFLLIQYITMAFVCRNFGNRFACNALAKVSISD